MWNWLRNWWFGNGKCWIGRVVGRTIRKPTLNLVEREEATYMYEVELFRGRIVTVRLLDNAVGNLERGTLVTVCCMGSKFYTHVPVWME